LTTMQTEFSQNTGPTSDDGPTCEHGRNQIQSELTLSAVGSLAKTLARLEKRPGSMEKKADCGLSTKESFAHYCRQSLLWKTSQISLFGGLSEFSETWPRSGMMLNGMSYRLPLLALRISARDASYVPNASGFYETPLSSGNHAKSAKAKRLHSTGLSLEEQIGGIPNPEWLEWLMGFPKGWTDIAASETPSCHKSPNGSGEES